MNPLPAIAALLKAITAALNAFPLWLAWRINSQIEDFNERIIELSAAGTAQSLRLADELRLKRAYRLRLHDALLPSNVASKSGDGDSNIIRAVSVSD